MTREDQDELWHALGVLSRYARDGEVADRLPGLGAVVEVLTEQVGDALNEIERAQAQGRAVRGRSMTITRLGQDGKPIGETVNVWGGLSLTVGERPTAAEYREKLKETKRKRGIR